MRIKTTKLISGFAAIFFLFLQVNCFGQSSINATGVTEVSTDQVILSYSIGDVIANSYATDDIVFAEGVLQPVIIIAVTTGLDPVKYQLSIYPNPSTSEISIKSESQDFNEIAFLQMDGKEIIRKKFQERINVSQLPQGQYVLRLISKDSEVIKDLRFIKLD
ncbi:MAG: T9SS type A sorting domain-containing protein [Reichenbachiella sp.]|uniref:T9SS type A sorting domain-containing protein n=1 Tax=Reichenbachiella sp. TaxID=2184521 RepID=UPI0032639D05